MMGSNSPVVVLASGGLDSITIIYHLLKRTEHKVFPLYFNYGQKHHDREYTALEGMLFDLAHDESNKGKLGLPTVIDISDISRRYLFHTSSLVNPLIKIPKVTFKIFEEELQKEEDTTNVPFRGNIFVSLAVPFALSVKADQIYMMNTATYNELDPSHYDGNAESLEYLKMLVKLGTNKKVELICPFQTMLKHEIISLARSLKVPIERTYSCYSGNEKPCGKCRACYERRKGLNTKEATLD